MNKIYLKCILVFLISLFFLAYYVLSSHFKEEIETDNNILEWNNELLEHKKRNLEQKNKKKEYYNKKVQNLLTKKNQSTYSIDLTSFAKQNQLRNFTINTSKRQKSLIEQNLEKAVNISWDIMDIDFSCNNEWQVFLLLEKINKIPGIILRSMDISHLNNDIFVKINVQSYYFNINSL